MKIKFIITSSMPNEAQAWKIIELPYIPAKGMAWTYELLDAKVAHVGEDFGDLDKWDAEVFIDTNHKDMVIQLMEDEGWLDGQTQWVPCDSDPELECEDCSILKTCNRYSDKWEK